MKSTFSVVTLGCKTNQFESVSMEEKLAAAGYRPVPFEEGADLVIVNTCTVTAATDSQSRNLIRRARRQNLDCRIIVTGCYAQVDPEAIRTIPGVTVVLGNDDKKDLIRYLGAGSGDPVVAVSDIRGVAGAVPHEINSFSERSRAFVQIQNGCNAFCSYCIIPYARGSSRSAQPAQVVEQVRRLVGKGYPELVLTGIHIGAYGSDLDPVGSLVELLQRIEKETEVRRLRLGSIEPNEITDELIDAIDQSAIICPHLHIPLQSGDDQVLQRMNRHYSANDFYRLIEKIHARLPDIAFGFDVITGFPVETEEEFNNTRRLVEALPVSYLHVFPYSRRPGTPAADLSGQVPGNIAKERAATLRIIADEKNSQFARRFIGQQLDVVVESVSREDNVWKGLTRHYLPVSFKGTAELAGSLADIEITGWQAGQLVGSYVGKSSNF
ncbi:MAG: tRNA (N(6)-L-threonylcarbamoyladenosine(37)-C(2))-methylthiotransferase MtaB [Desulfuromonas sp.]|nr:MAG: tRNA (N(6)-L-threonylcarbamoyladenosine(37)-C(2))-methylthiotransferase MtaB [Desulfuromonas sp.]